MTCPKCDAGIDWDTDYVYSGDLLECNGCGSSLRVVSDNPITLKEEGEFEFLECEPSARPPRPSSTWGSCLSCDSVIEFGVCIRSGDLLRCNNCLQYLRVVSDGPVKLVCETYTGVPHPKCQPSTRPPRSPDEGYRYESVAFQRAQFLRYEFWDAWIQVIAFSGSWVYCIYEYGYLFGVGLGWLPSIILTFALRWAWWAYMLFRWGFWFVLPGIDRIPGRKVP